ncbi:unnamed protein product, partial [Schistosoma turkestanicum]
QLALYKFDSSERTVTLWHLINDVGGTAIITSLFLLRMFIGVKTISISVYIGDQQNFLHHYTVIDKKFQLKQTLNANKSPIKFMERVSSLLLAASDNGEISVWKHDKHGVLNLLHRLNVCTDIPTTTNNSDNRSSGTFEKSLNVTGFFSFYSGNDLLNFEHKLYNPTVETIEKLMVYNIADNQHDDDDDDLNYDKKDPDSDITTISGECLSSSASYVTGSEQEIYECGYKLHDGMDEKDDAIHERYTLAINYLKDEQFHLLNSCKKGYIVHRETSYDATNRLFYGIFQSFNLSSQMTGNFSYRIFAPNILQYRGTLKGHSGYTPCALLTTACTTNNDEDCIIASASGLSINDITCDIRLWSIPPKKNQLNYHPNQHFGPITCLNQLKITSHYSICISGCIDGSVMFWSVTTSDTLNTEYRSPVVDMIHNDYLQCKPLAHVYCSAEKPRFAISDIATQIFVLDQSKPLIQYLIYIAYGAQLWRMRIRLDQSNLSTDSIQTIIERLFSMTTNGKMELTLKELDAFWSFELDTVCSDIG